jgi:hypothetical protein
MFVHGAGDPDLRRPKSVALGCALALALLGLALLAPAPKADATPNFARETRRSCNFCHSGVPRLNDTGLAFKNNGSRFPENTSSDPDHEVPPRP